MRVRQLKQILENLSDDLLIAHSRGDYSEGVIDAEVVLMCETPRTGKFRRCFSDCPTAKEKLLIL